MPAQVTQTRRKNTPICCARFMIATFSRRETDANRADRGESARPLTMVPENLPPAAVHPLKEAVQQWDGKAGKDPKTGVSRAQDGKRACA
jgi:hypothetical protein